MGLYPRDSGLFCVIEKNSADAIREAAAFARFYLMHILRVRRRVYLAGFFAPSGVRAKAALIFLISLVTVFIFCSMPYMRRRISVI